MLGLSLNFLRCCFYPVPNCFLSRPSSLLFLFIFSFISSQLVNSSQVLCLFFPVRLPYIRIILSSYLSVSLTLPSYCIPSHLPLLSFPVLGLSFSFVSFCVIIDVFISLAFGSHSNLRPFIGHKWLKPNSSRICNRHTSDFMEYSSSNMWNSRCHSLSILVPPMTLWNRVTWRKWKHLYVRCWTAVTRYRCSITAAAIPAQC